MILGHNYFMAYFKYISLPLIILFLASCGGAKFTVKSDPPQADVFIVDVKSGEKKNIGKTPLELPADDVKKTVQNAPAPGEFYTVVIEKTGFETQSLSVPAGQFTTVLTALDVKLKEGPTKKELTVAKEILDHLFLAQKLAMAGQFERAHIELDKIITPYPDFTKALTMRASIYYVQKNYAESLKWYEEALKVDPANDDAVKMIAKIKAGPKNANATPNRAISSEGAKK